jgi:hypothetical protein
MRRTIHSTAVSGNVPGCWGGWWRSKYKEAWQAVLDIVGLPWQHTTQKHARLGAVIAAAPELGYCWLSSIVFPASCREFTKECATREETIQLSLIFVFASATNIKNLTEKNRTFTRREATTADRIGMRMTRAIVARRPRPFRRPQALIGYGHFKRHC